MIEIPPHIQYCIDSETKLMNIRERQIENYKKKIELFKAGYSLHQVMRKCPEIHPSKRIFWYAKYKRLKEKWESQNEL